MSEQPDTHAAIAAQERRLSRARTTWSLGLISPLLWLAGFPFGVTAGGIVLAAGIVITPFVVMVGLGRASDAKAELRRLRASLPQLPEARLLDR